MLSHKARYALRALIALAQEVPGVQLTSGDISTKADAPRKFLEAILLQLSLTGLVVSKRGKFGGYRLGRAPSGFVTTLHAGRA